jgi:hypothetical protein
MLHFIGIHFFFFFFLYSYTQWPNQRRSKCLCAALLPQSCHGCQHRYDVPLLCILSNQSSVQLQILHWAGPSSMVLRMRAGNPTKERAFSPLTNWRMFALSRSLSLSLSLSLSRSLSLSFCPMALRPVFGSWSPQSSSSNFICAADFEFRTCSSASTSYCILFSHLIFLLAFYLRNFFLKSCLECDGLPNL